MERKWFCRILERTMIRNTLTRLVREEDGMEMVEWAIVAVVFAVAAAAFWSTLSTAINTALQSVSSKVAP
jgi:Flp pilus assembly pilin Flp